MKNAFALASLLALAIPSQALADLVFSADFETGDSAAAVGELLVRNEPVLKVEATSMGDTTLGDHVLLIDRELDQEFGLSFTIELSSPVALAGAGASFSFDYATRRINGISKTMLLTGWDTMGRAVFQFVLGDDNTFGNAQADRQRPGYATGGFGRILLPGPNVPGAYRWGSDTTDDGVFDVTKDAHIAISVGEEDWRLSMEYQGGASYSAVGLPTFDGRPHEDLARITVTSLEGENFGGYWDNLRVEGDALGTLPAPTGSIDIDVASQGAPIDSWGYDIKQGGKAEGLTPVRAEQLFVEDGMDLLRIPIWGDSGRPAHPAPGLVDESYYAAVLTAIANVEEANPGAQFFASKKLAGDESFPLWVKDGDGDGIDDGAGVVPEKYAIMLADYLRFFLSHGVFISLLGIDNEERFNEGQITPQKYRETIDALRAIAENDPNLLVPSQLIGAENFDPDPGWVIGLESNGWGDRADLFGTHYYNHRPLPELREMVAAAGGKPVWNTEVHWDNLSPRDPMSEAEAALAAFFDCTDLGVNGFSWWSYSRTGFKGQMERALVLSTHHASPVPVDDFDGPDMPEGSFITRAFRLGDTLNLWAINNHPDTDIARQWLRPSPLPASGPVKFTRWTDLGIFDGFAPSSTRGEVALSFPHRSITLVTIPIGPLEPQFEILRIERLRSGDLFIEARLPQLDQAYHVQISGSPAAFDAIPGSAFTPDQNPYSFTVDGNVLGDGDQLFLRLALGEAP